MVGEMHYGAQYSTNIHQNSANIQKLTEYYNVLGVDSDTAFHYGRIKAELRKKGRPVPENDIWIAAIALQHKLTLVTRDAHFNEVRELGVESW